MVDSDDNVINNPKDGMDPFAKLDAEKYLNGIKVGDITELKSLSKPAQITKDVLEVVMIILDG